MRIITIKFDLTFLNLYFSWAMSGYMYILECSDGSYYTGSTNDLIRRFLEYQNCEGANHTKNRLPVKLIYFEVFTRIDDAYYREKQIQGWTRVKEEALMNRNRALLQLLSECKNETHYSNLIKNLDYY